MLKKTLVGFAVVALALVAVTSASAATTPSVADLQAQIAQLMQQIAALTGGSSTVGSTSYTFTRDLTVGSTGADVTALQNYLISKGMSIPAGATGTFGAQTKAALTAYQASVGLPATGYFGPLTRANIASMAPSTPSNPNNPSTPSTPTNLKGGAGNATVSSKNSGTVDQVFEGDEDAKVVGADVKATGGDIAVTSVEVTLTVPSSGSTRLNRYVDSVDVMYNGKVVGTADASDFTKDGSDYTASIAVDNAVVKQNNTERFYVAVNALANIDSNDLGNNWTGAITEVRFEDATGAILTKSPSSVSNTFSFEDLSTAGDVSLTVSEDDTSVNDAHTVQVDNTSDTNDVELMSFKLKAKGTDVTVNTIPFTVTGTGAGATEILNDARLLMDGQEVGDAVVGTTLGAHDSSFASSSTATKYITFQNLDDDDVVINDGDEVTFTLVADINDLDGNFTSGDSLAVSLDSDNITAEDTNGDTLTDTDTKGTVTTDGTKFAASGVTTSGFTTVSATQKDYGSSSTPNHQGEYVMTFKVTAFENPAYIPLTAASSTSATAYGVIFQMEDSAGNQLGTGTTTASVQKLSGQGQVSSGYLHLEDGETATLQLTVNHDIATSGYARVQVTGVNFNDTSATTPNGQYVPAPASDYESSNLYIVQP